VTARACRASLALAAALWAMGCRAGPGPDGEPAAAPLAQPLARPLAAPLPSPTTDAAPPAAWTGVIAPARSVDLAPDFDGVLAEVAVRPGDRVVAGQVVALLEERPLREELDTALATLRETRARGPRIAVEIRSARRRVHIERQAVAAGTSARRVLEEAGFALSSARAARGELVAAIAQAETRVDRARTRLRSAALSAPFDGAVGARYRDRGAAVGPLTPVVRLIGGGALRLRFAAAPDAARALRPGCRVVAEVDGLPAIPAVIEQIAPELDQPSQRVFIDAALDPAVTGGLQPGLDARVRRSSSGPCGDGATAVTSGR